MNDSDHDFPLGLDNEASAAATEVEKATSTRVKTEERPKDLTRGKRDHVVILWNSEEHSFGFVIGVLMEVCKMTEEDAGETAFKVHKEGKAAVYHGLLEHCELKRDQLSTFRDKAVIEAGGPNIPLNVTVAEA